MSDLTDNEFYPSAERIGLCIRMNKAGKYCDRSTYKICRFWQKKNHLFRWSSFWSWRVRKQVKLLYLSHRKPAHIHWKTGAHKTNHCLVRILVQRHNWAIEQGETVTINGDRCQSMLNDFLFTKIEEEDIDNIWFKQVGAAIWHRWTIICGVPSKISVTPTSQRQMTL